MYVETLGARRVTAGQVETPEGLRQKANQARRLAYSLAVGDDAAERLFGYAKELEARAEGLRGPPMETGGENY